MENVTLLSCINRQLSAPPIEWEFARSDRWKLVKKTKFSTLYPYSCGNLWSISQKDVSLRSVVSVNFNQSKALKSHLRLILDLRLFVKSIPELQRIGQPMCRFIFTHVTRGRRGCGHMIVEFTPTDTYAISAYHDLSLWVLIQLMARCTRYNIMW